MLFMKNRVFDRFFQVLFIAHPIPFPVRDNCANFTKIPQSGGTTF